MDYISYDKIKELSCWDMNPELRIIDADLIETLERKSNWDIAIDTINEFKKNSDLPDTWRGALTLTVIMLKKVRQRKSKIEIELDLGKRVTDRKKEYNE